MEYYRDEPNNNSVSSKSFKSKIKITGRPPASGNEKDVEIMVPLQYLSTFWRTFEMPLFNYEVTVMLTWSSACVITNSTGAGTFEITDAKLYVPVVTLSTKDHAKLPQQLKSVFKKVINWNKYLSKPELLAQNPNLNHLVENTDFYFPNAEIKDYNVMINGEKFFDQPIKDNKVTYEDIRKISTGQGDDYWLFVRLSIL